MVEKGERLQKPDDCPDDVYSVMERCWSYAPQERPTFRELFEFFSNDPDYANLRDLISTVDIS